MRQCLYRTRSILPSLPRSLEDVHDSFDSCECKTNLSENFLLVNNRTFNIILFSCKTNLEYLCSPKKIYDVEYCSKFLIQLFTIHAVENGHYFFGIYFITK
jgi:hypothetical protein